MITERYAPKLLVDDARSVDILELHTALSGGRSTHRWSRHGQEVARAEIEAAGPKLVRVAFKFTGCPPLVCECKGPGYKTAVSSPKLTAVSSAMLTTARSAKLTTAGSAKLTT